MYTSTSFRTLSSIIDETSVRDTLKFYKNFIGSRFKRIRSTKRNKNPFLYQIQNWKRIRERGVVVTISIHVIFNKLFSVSPSSSVPLHDATVSLSNDSRTSGSRAPSDCNHSEQNLVTRLCYVWTRNRLVTLRDLVIVTVIPGSLCTFARNISKRKLIMDFSWNTSNCHNQFL